MPVPLYARSATYDIETGWLLDIDEVPWEGAWELEKKGRESEQRVTDASLQNAANDAQRQGEQYGAEKGDLAQLDTIGANGLGLGASGYLANQLNSIGRSYGNARQNAARINASRGLGSTPEGAFQSSLNGANLGQAGAENEAYNNAQMLTRDNMLQALGARAGLQNTYNPNGALSVGAQSAYDQNHMGSLLGDIGAGLSSAAGIVGSGFGLANQVKGGVCWIAEALWGVDDLRTHIVRGWLNYSRFANTVLGRAILVLYRTFGQRLAKCRWAVLKLRPLFNLALRRATTEAWQ